MKKQRERKCPRDWVKKKRLGIGSGGIVYRACCEDDCSFVMKEVKNPNIDNEMFLKEVAIQSAMSKKGLAPKIHYVDEKLRIVIMDSLEQNFWDFMKKELSKKTLIKAKQNLFREATMEILDLIRKHHDLGIVHGDTHGGNIMRNTEGKWYLIDYGLAKKHKKVTKAKSLTDLHEVWNTLYGEAKDSKRIFDILFGFISKSFIIFDF